VPTPKGVRVRLAGLRWSYQLAGRRMTFEGAGAPTVLSRRRSLLDYPKTATLRPQPLRDTLIAMRLHLSALVGAPTVRRFVPYGSDSTLDCDVSRRHWHLGRDTWPSSDRSNVLSTTVTIVPFFGLNRHWVWARATSRSMSAGLLTENGGSADDERMNGRL